MSVEGIILHYGEAHGVTLHQTRVDDRVTAEHSRQCSLFEFTVAPGFNTARITIPRLKRFSTFWRGSSICAAANELFVAGRELAYSSLPAPRTHLETPVRRPVGCS